jgi:hypothetical protein
MMALLVEQERARRVEEQRERESKVTFSFRASAIVLQLLFIFDTKRLSDTFRAISDKLDVYQTKKVERVLEF